MILEMDDGREFKLDDDMDDDTAKMLKSLVQAIEAKAKPKPDDSAAMLKRLISALEERARAADDGIAAMRAELIALSVQVGKLAAVKVEKQDDSALRKEIINLGQAVNKLASLKPEKGAAPMDHGPLIAALRDGFDRLETVAKAPTRFIHDSAGEIDGARKDV